MDIVVNEFDIAEEIDLYNEYAESEAYDVFIDELAIRHCGAVY